MTAASRLCAEGKREPAICMWCYVKHEPRACPERTAQERHIDKATHAFDTFERVKRKPRGRT
jgi:hypothetical protein